MRRSLRRERQGGNAIQHCPRWAPCACVFVCVQACVCVQLQAEFEKQKADISALDALDDTSAFLEIE